MGVFVFEELDTETRRLMLAEFDEEWAGGSPYVGAVLSGYGRKAFPALMREAIARGDEETLRESLLLPALWDPTTTRRTRGGSISTVRVSPEAASAVLARTEFNTWYVRGFSARLLAEGEEQCEVYRAAPAWEPRQECLKHEGARYAVALVYHGHRARYWPPGNPDAFSIPVGPNCHHTIRRIRPAAQDVGHAVQR